MSDNRTCIECKQEKPTSDFYKRGNDYQKTCKPCWKSLYKIPSGRNALETRRQRYGS